jgi:glycosyltransferase involved in cell wall biosynthesis
MTISVVLVSYNQEKYIVEALDGILSQTIEPNEVIIADDGSIDNTQQLIADYVNIHNLSEKWTLLLGEVNRGINANLQNAINCCSSDVLVIMAGDDISLPNRCEVTTEIFSQHKELLAITTSLKKIDEKGHEIGDLTYNNELRNDIFSVIKAGIPNVFPVGQALKRQLFETFGKLPNDVPNEDDQITFWGLLSGGFYCSSICTVKYRVHSNSASAWLRNRQTDAEYFQRFVIDMPIRKRHMELWLCALQQVDIVDKERISSLLLDKIRVYDFLGKIENYSLCQRLSCLLRLKNALCFREFYYFLGGKFGILSWRWLKHLLGR